LLNPENSDLDNQRRQICQNWDLSDFRIYLIAAHLPSCKSENPENSDSDNNKALFFIEN